MMTPEPKLSPDYLAAKRECTEAHHDRIAQIECDYRRACADEVRSYRMELSDLRHKFQVIEEDDDDTRPAG